ncbi:NUDIX domain-containing protein [Dactylosporangium salmoneum]|uniref:Nudix hydrolase domain-containing protein n=1 Tax=Dactylosporangium salmoneum TaxID=53361 RepID=A0ABP5SCU0_9ACTN
MAKARGKLSDGALAAFNIKHPRGHGGRFVKKGSAGAPTVPAVTPSVPTPAGTGRAAQRMRAARPAPTPGSWPSAGSSPAPAAHVAPAPAPATPHAAKAGRARAAFGASTSKPSAAAPPTATSSTAKVDTARDAIYGRHPKARQMAFQLSAYGGLRRDDFDGLSAAEKSTLLGDLSYIATTSKSLASTKRAQKLIDRFTPPGTPHGHIPTQSVLPPVSAVAGQTRFPNGLSGRLTVLPAGQRGQSGDGWFRLKNGQSGPWGKYGASGLMLRHVDPADGKERYLMVQRGPGISDPGKWQFPGGARESKEDYFQGAAREVVEELGFKDTDLAGAQVHGFHEHSIPDGWAYHSIAATVNKQLKPDLSSHHARMETADAKWMTRDEIDALDQRGELLKPLAGGQLQANVMSLFPPKHRQVGRPGPVTTKPARLAAAAAIAAPAPTPAKPPHKPSTGRDLLPDTATKDALRQQVKQMRTQYDGKTADGRLAAIGALQGFDDVPTVASKADMDKLLATGNYIEAWRGVRGSTGSAGFRATRGGAVSQTKSAADINEELRSGPAYYGLGIFGNGYYFATDKGFAEQYADGTKGSLVRVLIPKSAKIVPHTKVVSEARAASSSRSKAKGQVGENGTLYDEGRYAAAKGYDMIEIPHTTGPHVAKPGKPAFNILNRSVLVVEEA